MTSEFLNQRLMELSGYRKQLEMQMFSICGRIDEINDLLKELNKPKDEESQDGKVDGEEQEQAA